MRNRREAVFVGSIGDGLLGGTACGSLATSRGNAMRKIVRQRTRQLQGRRVDHCGRTLATEPKTSFPTIADVEVSPMSEHVGRLGAPDERRYIKRKKDPRYARFPK